MESNDPALSLPFYKQKMIAEDGTLPREVAWKAQAGWQRQGLENSHRRGLFKQLSHQLKCHV